MQNSNSGENGKICIQKINLIKLVSNTFKILDFDFAQKQSIFNIEIASVEWEFFIFHKIKGDIDANN